MSRIPLIRLRTEETIVERSNSRVIELELVKCLECLNRIFIGISILLEEKGRDEEEDEELRILGWEIRGEVRGRRGVRRLFG